ncbi:MAG: hypothetical protein IJJ60_03525 [Clostridia bacterium]|nr:hypothetical protein [Clostridia bacterium]
MFDKLYIAPILSPEGYISVLEKRAAAGFILRFGGLGATARNKLHFDIGVKMPRLRLTFPYYPRVQEKCFFPNVITEFLLLDRNINGII